MTILNTANDGLPNLLIIAYKALHRFGAAERAKLIAMCAPGVLESKRIRDTLNRWIELGLLVERDGHIAIDEKYRLTGMETEESLRTALVKAARSIVLSPENNKNFWDAEGARSADFSRGLAWLLAQDVYTLNTQSHGPIQELEHSQIKDPKRLILQNDVRWNGLKSWATFLGFGWESTSFVVDPTVAIREALADIFADTTICPAEDFVGRLRKLLPVLDFGEYRKQVEEVLEPASWSKPQDRWLSTSLSRALKRLEVGGWIRLQRRADVESVYQLTGRKQRDWDRFTHVSLASGE